MKLQDTLPNSKRFQMLNLITIRWNIKKLTNFNTNQIVKNTDISTVYVLFMLTNQEMLKENVFKVSI